MKPELKPGCLAIIIRPPDRRMSKRDLEVIDHLKGRIVELVHAYYDQHGRTVWKFKQVVSVNLPRTIRKISAARQECLIPLNDPDMEITDELQANVERDTDRGVVPRVALPSALIS